MEKRDIHLICNAHLDPVWLWQWQEGAAEAISTFRTAAELCESSNTFIFNHNEAILYKWILEYDSDLFRRIQGLVRAGKWHIMGGWFLQPDCNMPSGESFVRQILCGKSFFNEYFGIESSVAINFDPFGHSRGLVQILAKSGYDSYLFGRPEPMYLNLESEDFSWVGYDGSKVAASRFPGWYNTNIGKAKETVCERIDSYGLRDPMPVLWGVGNHGGGPSKRDLQELDELIKDNVNIKHSTPEKFFEKLQNKELPEHTDDINPWAVGCYSSQIRIKQQYRLLENEYFSTEKIASVAFANGLIDYPQQQLDEALYDLMVNGFHDILPGTSIEPVEQAVLRQIGHGLEILSRLKAKIFFLLASSQKKAEEDIIPVMVLNHHPFIIDDIVECEFNLADYTTKDKFIGIEVYKDGEMIPSQVETEMSNHPMQWRKKIAFAANLQPGEVNRFECKPVVTDKKPLCSLESNKGNFAFKTERLDVVINTKTGLIDKYMIDGIDYLKQDSFRFDVVKDNVDAWQMNYDRFAGESESFKLMTKLQSKEFSGVCSDDLEPIRIIEDGDVRTIVEAVFVHNNSFICQRYKLPKMGTQIEIETHVYWNEKDKMLKCSIPVDGIDHEYLGQVAYGRHLLPVDGRECVWQKWSAVVSKDDDKAFTCINNGTYASDFNSGLLRLTLLRSPAYTGHIDQECDDAPSTPQDRYVKRIDQGFRQFKFWFDAGKVSEKLDIIDTESAIKNESPFALSFFPQGNNDRPKPLAVLDDNVVQMTAVKKAIDGDNVVIRLFEPTGTKRKIKLTLPIISKDVDIVMLPFEIKTLSVDLHRKTVQEVDLLEKTISKS